MPVPREASHESCRHRALASTAEYRKPHHRGGVRHDGGEAWHPAALAAALTPRQTYWIPVGSTNPWTGLHSSAPVFIHREWPSVKTQLTPPACRPETKP